MSISLETDPLLAEISTLVETNAMSLNFRSREKTNSLEALNSAIEEIEQLLNELSK